MAPKPMLATSHGSERLTLTDPTFLYQPKLDGIRCLAEIGKSGVTLWSRDGNVKNREFPEIVWGLVQGNIPKGTILDGEIVAVDKAGHPTDFQLLQSRVHLLDPSRQAVAVRYLVFDLLQHGRKDVKPLTLTSRMLGLHTIMERCPADNVALVTSTSGDGTKLYRQALAEHWEGLMAKRMTSTYQCDYRSPDWIKLKLVKRQEFVIGGWTEPKGSREGFGALILGVCEGGALTYVGKVGTGFVLREMDALLGRLRAYEAAACPFAKTGPVLDVEKPHWMKPHYLAEVKFNMWTWEGKLRHPVYVGLRDDKHPRFVKREGAF